MHLHGTFLQLKRDEREIRTLKRKKSINKFNILKINVLHTNKLMKRKI